MASGKAIIFGAIITGAIGLFGTLLNGHLDRRSSEFQTFPSASTNPEKPITRSPNEDIVTAISPSNESYKSKSKSAKFPEDIQKPAPPPQQTTNLEIFNKLPASEQLKTPKNNGIFKFEDKDAAKLCDTTFKVDIQKSGFSTSGVVVLSTGSTKRHKLTTGSEWLKLMETCSIRLIETGRNPDYFAKIEARYEN